MTAASRPTATSAWSDWWAGTKAIRLWWTLACKDIDDRYRRSMLGPLWLTLSLAVLLGGMGPLYAALFKVPIVTFFPHLALGIICWTFISSTLNESCSTFIAAKSFLKSSPFPLSIFIWKTLARNLITLGHHIFVFLPVAIWAKIPFATTQLMALPGLLLLLVCLHAMALTLAIICTRFRDLPQIVQSALQMLVFVTPVMWLPQSLPTRASALLRYNPFNHMIEVVRAPLLGKTIPLDSWIGLAVWTVVCVAIASILFARSRRRLIYWL
jgi:lipopolysaccharide transport system permease protein